MDIKDKDLDQDKDRDQDKDKDKGKKQIPLRLSPSIYKEVVAWAEDDFRSINGQIEYLLSECIKRRKSGGGNTTQNQ